MVSFGVSSLLACGDGFTIPKEGDNESQFPAIGEPITIIKQSDVSHEEKLLRPSGL
jgi:hypothetical protein